MLTFALCLDQLFQNYSLSSAYLANLAQDIYRVFSVGEDNEHIDKSAQRDVVVMAQRLILTSVQHKPDRTVKYPAIDTVKIGATRLGGSALYKFNSQDCLLELGDLEAESLEVDDRCDGNVRDFFVSEKS